MHANIPIPEQQMVDGPRESSQAVTATPGSEHKNPTKHKRKRSSTAAPSSAETGEPRVRIKPPSLTAGVAAIGLDPNAVPSSTRKGKGSSNNNEVRIHGNLR